MAKEGKAADKDAFRGDADSYDSEASGPGSVDKQAGMWDSYNWGGEKTGSYYDPDGLGSVPFFERKAG